MHIGRRIRVSLYTISPLRTLHMDTLPYIAVTLPIVLHTVTQTFTHFRPETVSPLQNSHIPTSSCTWTPPGILNHCKEGDNSRTKSSYRRPSKHCNTHLHHITHLHSVIHSHLNKDHAASFYSSSSSLKRTPFAYLVSASLIISLLGTS